MRFAENGPDVPDELLIARDEGRVLFFCGAGVSKAYAGLADFVALSGSVLDDLGSHSSSPARRLYRLASIKRPDGEKSFVPVDRIFGYLDQEFDGGEVRDAVARALRPQLPANLRAHRVLLDLARDRAGVPALVTTNFDDLFEACDPLLSSWGPPNLPMPDRPSDFRGVIHLHGRVDRSYEKAGNDALVLSSRDFGRAYLSDGWATQYIRRLISRYHLIFVGYSADDPPVQYLLEALSDDRSPETTMYAFQAGDDAEAAEQWIHKGVKPIAFGDDYTVLWRTLEGWAERARDVDGWYDGLIEKGRGGPHTLLPHQRGAIAHLASTSIGAERIARANPTLPANWLFTFDPAIRFQRPGRLDIYDQSSGDLDPFELFGVDQDAPPTPIDPEDYLADRKVPDSAWSAFAIQRADLAAVLTVEVSPLISRVGTTPPLQSRLRHLGAWLAKVCGEPAALWWAAGKPGLHREAVSQIEWTIRNEPSLSSNTARLWRYLITSWRDDRPDANHRGYEIADRIRKDGWSNNLVREFIELHRPKVIVKRSTGMAPPLNSDIQLERYLRVDVEYPRSHAKLAIPAEYLAYAVSLWKGLLVYAQELETEFSLTNGLYLDTTRPEDGGKLDPTPYGLTGPLVTFTQLVEELENADLPRAQAEFGSWFSEGGTVFERLRIWGAGRPTLSSPEQAAQVFTTLSDHAFWGSQHERDLYFALRDRWGDLSTAARVSIEDRLLNGPIPFLDDREDADQATASYRLSAIGWLRSHGVQFGFDPDKEIARLKSVDERWRSEFVEQVAQPNTFGPYSIETDTDPTSILDKPIGTVLPVPPDPRDESFRSKVRHDPFAGLAARQPARALLELDSAMKRALSTPHEWGDLLRGTAERPTSLRFNLVVANLISKIAPTEIAKFWFPLADWLVAKTAQVLPTCPPIFDSIWQAIIAAAAAVPSPYRQKANRRWSDEALNAPIGRLAQALFKDPSGDTFKPGIGLPEVWKKRLGELLATPGDHRRHGLNITARYTGWLFQTDPEWARLNLVRPANGEDADSDAFWAGFAARGDTPQSELFIELKNAMLRRVSRAEEHREYAHLLAGMLLAGWGSQRPGGQGPIVSTDELRDVLIGASQDVQGSVLHHLGTWASGSDNNWAERVVPFLRTVWPKQQLLRTPFMAAHLVTLALSLPSQFVAIVEVIRPRLMPLSQGHLLNLPTSLEDFSETETPALLDVLVLVLPADRRDWPYDAAALIGLLAAQPELESDPRLGELKRRLAAT